MPRRLFLVCMLLPALPLRAAAAAEASQSVALMAREPISGGWGELKPPDAFLYAAGTILGECVTAAPGLHLLPRLQLRQQERRQQIRQGVAGTEIDPRVLVYLSAHETGPVRSLLPQDLRPLHQRRVVDQERSPFPASV